MTNRPIEAKVVLIGSNGVGKSSIIQRYLSNRFTPIMSPTIGASYFTQNLVIDEQLVRLNIWDTGGQERFRAMSPIYYRNASAAIVVYDITLYESFQALREWIKELIVNAGGSVFLTIVGNKCDLPHRQVSLGEGDKLARDYNAKHFESSALTAQNIPEIFRNIADQVVVNSIGSDITNERRLNRGYLSVCEKQPSESDGTIRRWGCC